MTIRRLLFSRAASVFVLPVLLVLAVALPAKAQDSSDFFLRLNQLENQVRELSGTVEKLEYDNRRLQEQLKRFQEDVEFRFQENAGSRGSGAPSAPPKQKRSDMMPAQPASPPQAVADAAPARQTQAEVRSSATSVESVPDIQNGGLNIIEEPADAQPAKEKPLQLGMDGGQPSEDPAPRVIEAPLQGQIGHSQYEASATEATAEATVDLPSVAATSPGDPQADYREAEGLLRRQQFEQAEMGFRQFLQSHPRDKLAPEATFNLGESYFFRGRYREAAEQYLKLTTAYPKSDLVPTSMLKLGMSLDALGAHDQACATFAETARKFPNGGSELQQGLARGRSRANCS